MACFAQLRDDTLVLSDKCSDDGTTSYPLGQFPDNFFDVDGFERELQWLKQTDAFDKTWGGPHHFTLFSQDHVDPYSTLGPSALRFDKQEWQELMPHFTSMSKGDPFSLLDGGDSHLAHVELDVNLEPNSPIESNFEPAPRYETRTPWSPTYHPQPPTALPIGFDEDVPIPYIDDYSTSCSSECTLRDTPERSPTPMTASRSVKRERSQSQSLHDSNSVTSCDSDGDGLPQAKRRRGGYVCGLDGCKRVCGTAGDLRRHHQSLRHGPPEFRCLACKQTFTRLDALRRHLKLKAACRRVHNRLEAQAVTIS